MEHTKENLLTFLKSPSLEKATEILKAFGEKPDKIQAGNDERRLEKMAFRIKMLAAKLRDEEKAVEAAKPEAKPILTIDTEGMPVYSDREKTDPDMQKMFEEWRKLKAEYAFLHNSKLDEKTPKEEREQAALRIVEIQQELLPALSDEINARRKELAAPSADNAAKLKRLGSVRTYVTKYKDSEKESEKKLYEKYRAELDQLEKELGIEKQPETQDQPQA